MVAKASFALKIVVLLEWHNLIYMSSRDYAVYKIVDVATALVCRVYKA